MNALHVRPNDAFDLSRGDLNPRRFLILPPAQVKHFLGEGFLSLLRLVGTQNTQACPHGLDTLACGKLNSCRYRGPLAAISTHATAYLINH